MEGGVDDVLHIVAEGCSWMGRFFPIGDPVGGEQFHVEVDEVELDEGGDPREDTGVICTKRGSVVVRAGVVQATEEVKDGDVEVWAGVLCLRVGVLDVGEGDSVDPRGVQPCVHVAHECCKAVKPPGDVD